MVQIKTLKNRKTGKKYSPRTHVKAVYDDNNNTLDSLLGVQDETLSELGSEVNTYIGNNGDSIVFSLQTIPETDSFFYNFTFKKGKIYKIIANVNEELQSPIYIRVRKDGSSDNIASFSLNNDMRENGVTFYSTEDSFIHMYHSLLVDVNFKIETSSADKYLINRMDKVETKGAYVNTSGVITETSSPFSVYRIELEQTSNIHAFLRLSDTGSMAIAFFNKDNVMLDGSIRGLSTKDGFAWFFANVPNNAEYALLTHKTDIGDCVVGTMDNNSPDYNSRRASKNKEDIDIIFNNITTSPFVLENFPNYWVRVSDGSLVYSGTTQYAVKYSVKGLKNIKVYGAWYDNLAAAIAFFSEDGSFLSDYTVEGVKSSNVVSIESEVPSEAAYAISCSAYSYKPIITTSNIGTVLEEVIKEKERVDKLNEKQEEILSKITSPSVYPTSPCMDYHHLFIDKIYTNSVVTIPSQSVFDVHVAAKLGFNMIEVNVLLTSDGVAVTGHQANSGGYLQTLTNLEGISTEVQVPNVTFEDLKNNYRYKSIFPQYRTPITSLEEFLLECKRYDLTPFVQCVNSSVVELTENIMGKKYVAYGATRDKTNVTIYEYRGGTIDEIVERCKSIGAPYVFGVSASTLDAFTDEEVKELVSRVHAEGCWLGWAGSYHSVENTLRYRSLGLDLNASGWDVPDFETGDEAFVYGNSIKGFSDFEGTYNVNEGVANLSDTQSMYKNLEKKSIIAKGSLHIQFKGELGITFGKINSHVTSDGLKEVVLTSIIENAEPSLYLYAYDDVEIYNVSYKVSSVI